MKSDDEYDKQVDLEPDEYTYEGKHEPVFGAGALEVIVTLVVGVLMWGFLFTPIKEFVAELVRPTVRAILQSLGL